MTGQAQRVAIIGAGGAVGAAILQAVHTHTGLTAVAVLRRPARIRAEIRLADATDPAALGIALDGIHLAVNATGGRHAALATSTAVICAAARQVGVRRVVHISSMAIHGGLAAGCLTEAAPMAVNPTAYEAAKIASEAAVRAHISDGHEAIILRPGLVFGPDSAQWAHRIARLLRAGRLGDLGPAGDGFCNLTHEADLGAATIAALFAPDAANLAINVATPDPPTWNEFFTMFARALGATPVRRIVARRLGWERGIAPLLQIARSGWTGIPDAIPAALQRLFAQRMRLDPALADRVLAFPRTPDAVAIFAAASRLPR